MFFRGNKDVKEAHDKDNKRKSINFDSPSDGDDSEDYLYEVFPKEFKILLAKIEDLHSTTLKELKDEIRDLKAERIKQDERLWEVINKLIDKPPPVPALSSVDRYRLEKTTSSGGGFAAVDKAAKK